MQKNVFNLDTLLQWDDHAPKMIKTFHIKDVRERGLASLIHAFSYTPVLSNSLFMNWHERNCHMKEKCILCFFIEILTQRISENVSHLDLGYYRPWLMNICAHFKLAWSDDVLELYRLIIDILIRQSTTIKDWKDFYVNDMINIANNFRGFIRTRIKCPSCNRWEFKDSTFHQLCIDVENANNLEEAIELNFSKRYDLKNNEVTCSKCHKKGKIAYTTKLLHLPNIMVILIRNLKHPLHPTNYQFTIPAVFEARKYMTDPLGRKLYYKLYSSIVNSDPSDSTLSGNCYANCLLPNQQWIKINDPNMDKTTLINVLHEDSYLVFYQLDTIHRTRASLRKESVIFGFEDEIEETNEQCNFKRPLEDEAAGVMHKKRKQDIERAIHQNIIYHTPELKGVISFKESPSSSHTSSICSSVHLQDTNDNMSITDEKEESLVSLRGSKTVKDLKLPYQIMDKNISDYIPKPFQSDETIDKYSVFYKGDPYVTPMSKAIMKPDVNIPYASAVNWIEDTTRMDSYFPDYTSPVSAGTINFVESYPPLISNVQNFQKALHVPSSFIPLTLDNLQIRTNQIPQGKEEVETENNNTSNNQKNSIPIINLIPACENENLHKDNNHVLNEREATSPIICFATPLPNYEVDYDTSRLSTTFNHEQYPDPTRCSSSHKLVSESPNLEVLLDKICTRYSTPSDMLLTLDEKCLKLLENVPALEMVVEKLEIKYGLK